MKQSIALAVFTTPQMLYHWCSVVKDVVKFQFPSCGMHFAALLVVLGATDTFVNSKNLVTTCISPLALATSTLSTTIFLHRDFGRELPASEIISLLPPQISIDNAVLLVAGALTCVARLADQVMSTRENDK
jgi:hypothetical protein